MAENTKAQLKTLKDGIADGGENTAAEIRTILTNMIDSLNGRFAGTLDCSTDPNYPASDVGMWYLVSVAGHIGGASGKSVLIGDIIKCITDSVGGTEVSVGSEFNIKQNLPFIRRDLSESDLFNAFNGQTIVLETDVIDLTATGTVEIDIPTGFKFFPDQVGLIIVDPATAITNVPDISFGEGSSVAASLLASTTMTGINASGKRYKTTTLIHNNGCTTLSITVTSAGVGTAYNGRAYFVGILQEDES